MFQGQWNWDGPPSWHMDMFPSSLFFEFIHLAVLGLCCCVGFSLVMANWGYSLVAMYGSWTRDQTCVPCSGGWILYQ